MWQWNSDAFGSLLPNEDPDGNGTPTTVNLRFPGQYFDQETGLHYNYFRDYDPRIGRYLESDPIGLMGGLNTFGYVAQNPLGFVDPYGLWVIGDPLPQWLVNASAGFGDGVSLGGTYLIRELMGINKVVDKCSGAYAGGVAAGLAVTAKGYAVGAELRVGRNLRLAPWGNRTGHPTGKFPHYHRRSVDSTTGQTRPGQIISRHRPWDTRSTDSSFGDRF